MPEKKRINTRVYYGEYTLRHWIDLMLKRNIELPPYQRSFVWEEKDLMRLIGSLKSGLFVPPITIAHYKDNKDTNNLILDGQQRLTSILLAYLGFIPDKTKIEEYEDCAQGDDSQEEESNLPIAWTFQSLLDNNPDNNTIPKITESLQSDDKYKTIDIEFESGKEDFYDNTFLGFSFIIPDNCLAGEIQKYFSTLFRNMNYFGKKLSSLESRQSLYYLNKEYKNYFDGRTEDGKDVLCNIRIIENMKPLKIDLVKYLSMLSQFVVKKKHMENDVEKAVMVGYSAYKSREGYYADYVSYIVGLEQDARQNKFDGFDFKSFFPNKEWKKRFVVIRDFLQRNINDLGLDENNAFTSWIDADYWLYGLLYCILFEDKSIVDERNLIKDLRSEINSKRNLPKDSDYSKNPNRLGNLRGRMKISIDIYTKYAE